jgi:hypothetical protein
MDSFALIDTVMASVNRLFDSSCVSIQIRPFNEMPSFLKNHYNLTKYGDPDNC